MKNTTTNDNDDAVKNISQVTPNNRFQQHIKKGQLIGLILLCATIVAVMFIPHKKSVKNDMNEASRQKDNATLSQNLALLNQLRAQSSSGNTPIIEHRAGMHPPKLRHTNQSPKDDLSKEMRLRMNASTTFQIESGETPDNASSRNANGATDKAFAGRDANSQFMNGQNDITMVSAKKIPHPNLTVPAGEMIPATLETAINSDLPGMVRAITTRDVYSLMGNNLLIPRASTLVGQFNSAVTDGQTRVLVVWDRVQLANGVIVTLDSPGTDRIGRSGQGADDINRHFFECFGTSALLSVLGAYTAVGGVGNQTEFNSASQYRMGMANSFQQASGQSLGGTINIKPTLSINQGADINIFVAHDLDFHAVGAMAFDNENSRMSVRGAVWK